MSIRHITVDRNTSKVNIYARDDARIYYSMLGKEGIHDIGNKMQASITNKDNNGGYTVHVLDGVCSIQGRIAIIDPSDYHDLRVSAESSDVFPRHDRIVVRFSSDSSRNESITIACIKNNGALRTNNTFTNASLITRDVQIADVYVQSRTNITISMLSSSYIRNINNIDSDVKTSKTDVSTLKNKTSGIVSDNNGGYRATFSQINATDSISTNGDSTFNNIDCNSLTCREVINSYGPVNNSGPLKNTGTVTNDGTVTNNSTTTCKGAVTCNSTLNVTNYIRTHDKLWIKNANLNTVAEVFKITRGSSDTYPLSLNYTTTNIFLLKYNNSDAIRLGTDVAFVKKINAEGGIYATKDVNINGLMKCNNILCGSVQVTPQVNTTKSQWVSFPKTFKTAPIVTVTAQGTVPSELKALTVSGITTNGFYIYLLKSSAATTTINWIAMDMASALNI